MQNYNKDYCTTRTCVLIILSLLLCAIGVNFHNDMWLLVWPEEPPRESPRLKHAHELYNKELNKFKEIDSVIGRSAAMCEDAVTDVMLDAHSILYAADKA